ncbi:hypothetical protein, partial [Chromobacterium vaccinii]|uniref:hypothetical protein n=1 Tax=Chromobacterium vaccinii TaxID=1108595 RepID=UPI000A4E64EF
QGVAMATGMQKSFSWSSVAASGVAAWATSINGLQPGDGADAFERIGYGTMRGVAGGTIQSVLGDDHRPNWGNLAANSFGSAIGDAIMPAIAQRDTVLTTEDGLPASRFPVAISAAQARSMQDGGWNPLDDLAALGTKLSSSSAAQARSGSVTSWTEVESVLRDGPIIDLGHQDVFAKPPSLWQKVVKFFSTPDYSGYSDQALAQVDTWAARTEYADRMQQRLGRASMGRVLSDFVGIGTMAAGAGVGSAAFNALRGVGLGYAASGMGAGVIGDLTTQVADNAAYQASGGRVGRYGLDKTELALSAVLPLAAELPGVARGGAERLRALGVPDWEVKLRQQDFGVLNSNPLPFELERVVPSNAIGAIETASSLGRVVSHHSAITPGTLDSGIAGTFTGGRYSVVELAQDTTLYRAGTAERPLGQFFDVAPPEGVLQTRIDKAVLPVWPGGGTSPIDTLFAVHIPKGTMVYVGEVGSQGGFYVGGTQQIVVLKPWAIDGVKVINSSPLK